MKVGCKLFDKVGYISRPVAQHKNLAGESITVFPTYPYNVESKTAGASAESWGKGYGYENEKYEFTKLERDNEPIEITIIGLEHRAEGGRAYKVIDNESRLFDLREDQVVESLNLAGIRLGGKINGEFVWGTDCSQTKLVLVGGKLHAAMLANTNEERVLLEKRKNGELPRESTLKIGYVYAKKDGTQHLYLGKVQVPKAKKPMFAFIEVSKPKYYDKLTFEWLDKNPNTYKDAERANLKWYIGNRDSWDSISPGTRHEKFGSNHITLLASPKFVSESEVSDAEYALALRENLEGKLTYCNGFGDDMCNTWYRFNQQENMSSPPYAFGSARSEWYNERDERMKKFYKKVAIEFRNQLVWL